MPRKFCNRLNGFLIVEHACSCRHHLIHRAVSTTSLTAQKPLVLKSRSTAQIDGKDRRITLAAFPVMSLAEAHPSKLHIAFNGLTSASSHLARIELSGMI
jgi:hypothetical protein